MRSLIARPGRNAARQAKKLDEIRKVKNAIKWHERERKERHKIMHERWEGKQATNRRVQWKALNDNVRKDALARVKEDWRLGPLRPNRAFGEGKQKYGAQTTEQLQRPEFLLSEVKHRNELRERKGLSPVYPLVVDDKLFFPIAADDRVAILKGKDKGKIGTVQSIVESSHQVIVKDINKQYIDSDLFNRSGQDLGPRHESEVPINMEDVRLVIPYEINQGGVRRYTDAIVEEIRMERHTTGIDPFTGTDYGSGEIPKDHQYDPKTGLPIFNRYIAGTQQRIEWPWEKPKVIKNDDFPPESSKNSRKKKSLVKQAINSIRHPITSIKSWTSRPPRKVKPPTKVTRARKRVLTPEQKDKIEQKRFDARELKQQRSIPQSHKSKPAQVHDGVDSTSNIVESAEASWYSLVQPPFPETLGSELQDEIHDHRIEVRKSPDAPPKIKAKHKNVKSKKVLRARQMGIQSMKTPLQLRWEMEQARKLADRKKNPLVETNALLAALGKHMVEKGVRMPKQARKVESDVD